MKAPREICGTCLCGALRFSVSGEARNRCYCHCRSCRLASGAPFVAWATFARERVAVLAGTLAILRSSESVERGFCAQCGTTVSYAHAARAADIDIAVATLEDASAFAPQCHIWVSAKPDWVVLGDGLPQYAEWRTSSSET